LDKIKNANSEGAGIFFILAIVYLEIAEMSQTTFF